MRRLNATRRAFYRKAWEGNGSAGAAGFNVESFVADETALGGVGDYVGIFHGGRDGDEIVAEGQVEERFLGGGKRDSFPEGSEARGLDEDRVGTGSRDGKGESAVGIGL